MKQIISALVVLILTLCVFNESLSAVLGVSSYFVIGLVAAAIAAVAWIAPIFDGHRGEAFRYENRLVRRPGH